MTYQFENVDFGAISILTECFNLTLVKNVKENMKTKGGSHLNKYRFNMHKISHFLCNLLVLNYFKYGTQLLNPISAICVPLLLLNALTIIDNALLN